MGGVVIILGDMVVGRRRMHCANLGVHAIGVQYWGGGVVMLVGDMEVGQRHMHFLIWGYMQWGYSTGVGV